MIVNNNKQGRIASQGLEGGNFKIDNNEFLYDILTNMYKDPLGSCIRELGTNAKDSHTEKGNKAEPFDVILPTITDDSLTFRDYGVGLSKEMMIDVYLVYLKSTKRESNDVTGCLGLGSKTPFIISDVMIVTAIKDGLKNILQCDFTNSVPDYIWLGDNIETDERDGLEVKIPLRNKFTSNMIINKIKQQYKYFEVKPNIINSTKVISYGDTYRDKIINTPNCKILKGHGLDTIVMNEIGYPLNLDELLTLATKLDFPNTTLEFVASIGRNFSFVINIPPGQVKFNPSREHLIYNSRTVINVLNAINNSLKHAEPELIKYYESLPEFVRLRQYYLYTIHSRTSLNPEIKLLIGYGYDMSNTVVYNTSAKLVIEAMHKLRLMKVTEKGNYSYIKHVDAPYYIKDILSNNCVFTLIDKKSMKYVPATALLTKKERHDDREIWALVLDDTTDHNDGDFELLHDIFKTMDSNNYKPAIPYEREKHGALVKNNSNVYTGPSRFRFTEYSLNGRLYYKETIYLENQIGCDYHVWIDHDDLLKYREILLKQRYSTINSLVGYYTRTNLLCIKKSHKAAFGKSNVAVNAINWSEYNAQLIQKVEECAKNGIIVNDDSTIKLTDVKLILNKYENIMTDSVSRMNSAKRIITLYSKVYEKMDSKAYMTIPDIELLQNFLVANGSKYVIKYKMIDDIYPEFKHFNKVMKMRYPLINEVMNSSKLSTAMVEYISYLDSVKGAFTESKYNEIKAKICKKR